MTNCNCPCFCGGGGGGSATAVGCEVGSSRGGRATTARIGSASADLSRVEQLVGGAAMVRGCALGVGFVVRATEQSPGLSVSSALDLLDAATTTASTHARAGDPGGEGEMEGVGDGGGGGLGSLFLRAATTATTEGMLAGRGDQVEQQQQQTSAVVPSFCGGPLVALPRRFEVAAALHRLPGVKFRPAVAAGGDPALFEEAAGTDAQQ